ncbi:MAG: hypothetical protein AB1744_06615, partial [Candidatus Zixiibacteriota bacterium]
VPPGSDVEHLIKQTGSGVTFWKDSTDKAVSFLCDYARRFLTGAHQITPLPEYTRRFSSSNLAQQFAELFDRILKRQAASAT